MKLEQYYRVETVALGVAALLAAAVVWVELTAPETSFVSALLEIIWLSATVYLVVLSVRRKLGIISNPRVRPWMLLALSLFLFIVLTIQIDELGTLGLPKTLSYFRYLVLAVLLLFAFIVKVRYARSIQEDD